GPRHRLPRQRAGFMTEQGLTPITRVGVLGAVAPGCPTPRSDSPCPFSLTGATGRSSTPVASSSVSQSIRKARWKSCDGSRRPTLGPPGLRRRSPARVLQRQRRRDVAGIPETCAGLAYCQGVLPSLSTVADQGEPSLVRHSRGKDTDHANWHLVDAIGPGT